MIHKVFEGELCRVTFSLSHAMIGDAKDVSLMGDFGGTISWILIPMVETPNGFEVELSLPINRIIEFMYIVDGVYCADWNADAYRPNPYRGDNSLLITRDYSKE